jgi:proline iminopeptidase
VFPNGFHMLEDFSCLAPGRTLGFCDVRNRGRSDTITDPAVLTRGIHNDVDDLDAVQRHFGLDRLALIGHSSMGLMVILYAMKYPAHVDRIVRIGAMGPFPSKQYPPELTANDDVLRDTMAKLAACRAAARHTPGRLLPEVLVDPARDLRDGREGRGQDPLGPLRPTERARLHALHGGVRHAVDPRAGSPRNAGCGYRARPDHPRHEGSERAVGGAKDWASLLPNVRLETVHGAGHAPWIEKPSTIFRAIEHFLAAPAHPRMKTD